MIDSRNSTRKASIFEIRLSICRYCDCRDDWERRSLSQQHCKSQKHIEQKAKAQSEFSPTEASCVDLTLTTSCSSTSSSIGTGPKRTAQISIVQGFNHVRKAKRDKNEFVLDSVSMLTEAGIALEKFDIRQFAHI